MSSTFERQSSNLSQLGKKQKLFMMAEYLNIVNLYQDYIFPCCLRNDKKRTSMNLFVIFPREDEEDEGDGGT